MQAKQINPIRRNGACCFVTNKVGMHLFWNHVCQGITVYYIIIKTGLWIFIPILYKVTTSNPCPVAVAGERTQWLYASQCPWIPPGLIDFGHIIQAG